MSLPRAAHGERMRGSWTRRIAVAKLVAVIGEPSLNRAPVRSLNVKVRPFAEMRGKPTASSGRGPALSLTS